MQPRYLLVVLTLAAGFVCSTWAEEPTLTQQLTKLDQALNDQQADTVKTIAGQLMTQHPQDAAIQMHCGECLYRVGEVEKSLEAFDAVVALRPEQKPHLWQRGIALYDLGKYDLGRQQFEIHREVNGNDVENATYHYVCVAGLEGAEVARKKLLPAPGDARVPMHEVYELYAGRATPEQVMASAEKIPATGMSGKLARFYGSLYIGLWHRAAGRNKEAIEWLERAVATEARGYMYDVARVHLKRLRT